MLVLTRKAGQTIMIGDDIEVTITGINKGHVRVAIHAPKEVAVDRAEIRAAKIANPRTEGGNHASI